MYEDSTNCGHSYTQHGSVKYYSPSELSRICRQRPVSDYILENQHSKPTKREDAKHHRNHNRPKKEITELDYDESTFRKKKEKRKHKKEQAEKEQFYSVSHRRKERRKHKKPNQVDEFSELNPQDVQCLMKECDKDDARPSNFGIGYYELKNNLKCRSIDQIPTRDISSIDKSSERFRSAQLRNDSQMKKSKRVSNQRYPMSPEVVRFVKTEHEKFGPSHKELSDRNVELEKFGPLHKELSDQRKMKKNKEKSSRGNEYLSDYKSSDCFSIDQINEITMNTTNSYFKKHNYLELNSEESIQQNRKQRHYPGDNYHFGNYTNNEGVNIPRSKHQSYEIASSQLGKAEAESEKNMRIALTKIKARNKTVDNNDDNYKLMKKYKKKISKEQKSEDSCSRTRRNDFELDYDQEIAKNRNHHKKAHEEHLSHEINEDKDKKKRRLRKHRSNLVPLNLDDERGKPTKIPSKKFEHKKHKSRKESIPIKSSNKSRLLNLSLDRTAKMKESIEDSFRNYNFHGIMDHTKTALNKHYKSESSLSTLHRKNRDQLKNLEPLEKTIKGDTLESPKKYRDVLSNRLAEPKHVSVNTNKEDTLSPYIVDQIIFPVELDENITDTSSMLRRIELFETAMKEDLSVRSRSNLNRIKYIPSRIEAKVDIENNEHQEFKNNEEPIKEVHCSDVGTSTIQDNDIGDVVLLSRGLPGRAKKKSVHRWIRGSSKGELDQMESTYGLIVKGMEPLKTMDTLKSKLCAFPEKKKKNNLECKILSVVAITPDNLGNKKGDLSQSIMKSVSTSQLLPHKDAASQVRNPYSDKRLERLLKYYRADPSEVEGGCNFDNFSNCCDRSPKDITLIKKLIISRLADYFKKLDKDNAGEIIEFRIDNSRAVKLVLPMDCFPLECSYDINFSKRDTVDDTAKESSSDLYINYSDNDDFHSNDNEKEIHMKIHIDKTRDNETKRIIIPKDSDIGNAIYSKDYSDSLFSRALNNQRNVTNYETELNVNERDNNIPEFTKKELHVTLPTEHMKFMTQSLPVTTNNQCWSTTDNKFIAVESIDIENASTFIVSENEQSSALFNCLPNFQTSPRDSIDIKSLNEVDLYNKRVLTIPIIETNRIHSKNLSQIGFGESKNRGTGEFSRAQLENLITAKTIPQRRQILDYFHSQNTFIETGSSHGNEENNISTLEVEKKSKKAYQASPRVQESSQKANDFFPCHKNELAMSDSMRKEEDHIDGINQSVEDKSGFAGSSQQVSTSEVTTRKLDKNWEIFAKNNDRKGQTFMQNEKDQACREYNHGQGIIDNISSHRINNIAAENKKHYSPNENIVPNNEPEAFLLEKHENPEIVTGTIQQNNQTEHLTKRKCDHQKKYKDLSFETNRWETDLKRRQNFETEQTSLNNHIVDDKKLDSSLRKCLDWNIKDSSKTMMGELADTDQNRVSGLDKSTQKSSNVSRKSFIPVAKKEIPKSPNERIRSSSVGADNNTTLLLTKSYRMPLGQSCYERRKLYDTTIRKNIKRRSLSESSGTTNKIPLTYEVRYFNINQCAPLLVNEPFRKKIDSKENIDDYTDYVDLRKRGCSSLSTVQSSFLRDSEYYSSSMKANNSEENMNSFYNSHIETARIQESHDKYSISPRTYSMKCIHESRKMKMNTQKEKLSHDFNCNEANSDDHRGTIQCTEEIFNDDDNNSKLQKKTSKTDCQNEEPENCQNLTKLPIEKLDKYESFPFCGDQNFSSIKTQCCRNSGERSVASSSAEGDISEIPDAYENRSVSSENTLINCQVYSSSSTTESKETVKAVKTHEIIEHSVIDSGYLTKEAEVNYSRTTFDGGQKLEESKSSLEKVDIEICQSVNPKALRWGQKDIHRLKIQLLFPDVYDDFELIEAAENTELIKFYIESANDKLKGAIESISLRKNMNIKSRSVISLPSVKMIPEGNEGIQSRGDISSESSFKMSKGGFYNYQKFIAQNNDQYSSDVLSKIRHAEDYRDGKESPDYPRSESSSMKSSSVNSVKSTSTRKSIIELFRLKSQKNEVGSSEIILNNDIFTEKGNISEEQFSNHFHQIMALECQKFAKKVKNHSLVKEEIEEFEEIPLEFILKNRNISFESRVDCFNSESLPSTIEIDNNQNHDKIDEYSTITHNNFSDTLKIKTNDQINADEEFVMKKLHETLINKSMPRNDTELNSTCHRQENLFTSDFNESSLRVSSIFAKSSNYSPESHILDFMPIGNLTKQSEKEIFDNLLIFYDHESEFTMKLIRDDEFFVSLIDNIRNYEDSFNIDHQIEMKKKIKNEKKQGILARFFRRKKKSTETLFTTPSISESMEFAQRISAESTSVRKDSCYSFYKDIEDFEKGASETSPSTIANAEILKQLAHKAKCHLESMLKATLSNQFINDRIKLTGFLKFLEMIEKGDITFLNNGNNKSMVEAKLREHVAQLFDKVYKIANREVVQRNIILDNKKIDLLKFLVTKYHMGVDIHINILAIYIGRSLIQSRKQLEDAILCLMRMNTDEVNLEDFERNCGIYRVQ